MKEAIRFFRRKIGVSYIFNMIIAVMVLVISIALYHTYLIAQIALYGSVIYFLIPFVLYMKKSQMLNSFFIQADDLNDGEYKTIDTSVLTQKHIYSYSLDQMVKMDYQDIVSAQHVGNIFEIARPGYRGNHKVIIKSDSQIIQMNVQNAEIADKILNFIATKNPSVLLENHRKEITKVQFHDLENWQVKGRF